MKFTVLPWMNALSAGRIVAVIGLLLIAYNLFEYFLKKHSLSLRRGQFAIISNSAWALCLNTAIYTLAFWYWAVPLSLAIGVIFWVVIRGELKTAREEELDGAAGINPAIRQIRSEIFADLPIEEQLEFKKNYRPQKFYWWCWLPLMAAIPFLIVMLLEFLGCGDYLFRVVYFK